MSGLLNGGNGPLLDVILSRTEELVDVCHDVYMQVYDETFEMVVLRDYDLIHLVQNGMREQMRGGNAAT